jgi:hypothetical protein
MAPQASRMSTSHAPTVAAEIASASARRTQRGRAAARRQLAGARLAAAWTAAAVTAAPDPAPAPSTQSRGEAARKRRGEQLVVAEPAVARDAQLVQQRDVRRRAAEADAPDASPLADQHAQARSRRPRVGALRGDGVDVRPDTDG